MQKINIGILGGDYRYKILKNLFKSEELNVKTFGNIHIENNSASLDEMLDNTDLLIGPIPYTKDKKYINLFCEDKISISELLLKTTVYALLLFLRIRRFSISQFFMNSS